MFGVKSPARGLISKSKLWPSKGSGSASPA